MQEKRADAAAASAQFEKAWQHADIQERLANLELREKMTCFDANRYHLEERTDKSAWAFNIIGTRGPRSICTEAPTAKSGRSSSAISSEHSRPSRHAR